MLFLSSTSGMLSIASPHSLLIPLTSLPQGQVSDCITIIGLHHNCGVPQGTQLGPVIFLRIIKEL